MRKDKPNLTFEELREKLCKKVDLLNTKELVQNENLISEILKDGIKIYG